MSTLAQSQLHLKLIRRGKVRDVYEWDNRHFLIVTSDRLSAFDVILPSPIPEKGAVLTKLTRFWMEKLRSIVPNHLTNLMGNTGDKLSALIDQSPELGRERLEIVRKADVFPVECVVRGYLAGSGWKDYSKTGEVCGHKLPMGMRECEKLPQPIFTPSTKAHEGHDENINLKQTEDLIGKETAQQLRDMSIALYTAGSNYALERGILIADTKFEFGLIDDKICLVDEVLTPDSSRFWPQDRYEPGHDQPSFDKQIVRNYLLDIGWDKTPPGPVLPAVIVERTAQAYREILMRLTQI